MINYIKFRNVCCSQHNTMQQNQRQNYHQNFGKNEIAMPLLSYTYSNCIIVISYNIYSVQKFLCNFILQKPRSEDPKNFGKSETNFNLHTRKFLKKSFCVRVLGGQTKREPLQQEFLEKRGKNPLKGGGFRPMICMSCHLQMTTYIS